MNNTLYHPKSGYYTSGVVRVGRRGDFITSPEVGPLFGVVLANWLESVWRSLGQPDPFRVFDVGANRGALLNSIGISDADFLSCWQPIGVDFVSADLNPSEFASIDLTGSVVLANELLDNLEFRIVERSSCETGWVEICVNRETQEFESQIFEPGNDMPDEIVETLSELEGQVEMGVRVPLLQQANHWVSDVIERGAARVLAFDYGKPKTIQLLQRGSWLRTYLNQTVAENPLSNPGELDITTDVGFDQLRAPQQLTTQASFLQSWGIEQLVAEGAVVWEQNAANPKLEHIRMRSRSTESDALTAADGLGSWCVAEW